MSTSRRDFLATSAAALGALITRPSLGRALAQPGQASPVFTPIRRNIGYFTMRGGTIGYLANSSAVVVVDSQFPPEAKACLDGLNQRTNNHGVDLMRGRSGFLSAAHADADVDATVGAFASALDEIVEAV